MDETTVKQELEKFIENGTPPEGILTLWDDVEAVILEYSQAREECAFRAGYVAGYAKGVAR